MYLIIVGFGFIFMIRDSTRGVSGISSIWRGVGSSADWDAEHPAGTSLNDLARFSSNTPWPYIQSGYTQKYHEQLNGEYYPVDKLISELTPDDMTLLPRGGFYFRFVTRPAQPGKHTLFVRLTADDGKVFEASCDVEFQ